MQVNSYSRFAREQGSDDTTWFRNHDYDPIFLKLLTDAQTDVLIDWHKAVAAEYPNAGASGVEMMTMLTSLITANGLSRVVQCGHYVGFSTLILGFVQKYMGNQRSLFTIDLDPAASAFAENWVRSAGLQDDVEIVVRDSSDPINVVEANAYLGGPPQLVYIDSSHQYAHTLRELYLWWDALPPGGLLVMDDISLWAADFDSTRQGGSHRAALQFRQTMASNGVLVHSDLPSGGIPGHELVYRDICGFGMFQKPNI